MNPQKLLSLSLLSLLAVSVFATVAFQTQNAQALSAVSISNQSTFSSLNSGKWKRVWTNTGGTGTYFVDTDGASFKSVLINNTSGATTTTALGALVGTPVTVSSNTASTTRTDILYNQNLGGSTQNLNNAGTTFMTEFAATSSSQLVGQTINSITLYVKKTGTPAGTATFGVFDSSGNTVTTFGTQDVSLLTTSYVATTYTSTTAARTIANGDRIGVFFNGGSAGNSLDIEYNNNGANVYDGTANSIVSTATGAQGAAVYTSQTARDIRGSFQYVYGAGNANLATFSATELYENQGQIIRAMQSDDDSTENVRTGANTIAAEKAAASSTLIGTSTYDTIRVYLKKTGSPTGTATIGVFDSSGNTLATFGTQDVSLLTTSFALKTYQSSSAISIASGQYVGIKFAGGSAGNTLDVQYTATNPYDGTNSVLSRFNGATWTDTSTADLAFKLSQEITGAASQESGANIYADFGSNQQVGGIYAYFPDSTKIPSSIKLSTSTDNISYTDRATISPAQSVGAQYLTLDASYSVRYVKLTVVTWGTAKSMQLGTFVRLPTSSGSFANLSAIEDSGSVVSVWYASMSSGAASTVYTGQINLATGQVIQATTFTWSANLSISPTISATKNLLYMDGILAASGHWVHRSATRALGSLSAEVDTGTVVAANGSCAVKTDGAAAAQDEYYCLEPTTGSGTIIYKVVNSLAATNLGSITGNSATETEISNLSDKMIARSTAGGTTRTLTITKATDALSSVLYTSAWTTYTLQQFDFTGSVARTFKTNTEAYYATTSYAIHYTPAGVLTDPAEIWAETVTPGTSTISNIANTFYRVSNTLVVSGSSTTWTPKVITAAATLTPTAYTEKLTIPLALNTTSIETLGVVKLVCDANYVYPVAGTLYTGSDSDCTLWRTLDTTSGTAGRELPFNTTTQLVHAAHYNLYTISLNVQNPNQYNLYSSYGGKNVDYGPFDSSGQLQQRLLYGQCYTMTVTEVNTGNSVQSGNICAGDVTTKTISLSGIVIPANWLSQTWSHVINRNFTNPTANGITFAIQKSEEPYSVQIYATDHPDPSLATFSHWFNFTGATGVSIANLTTYNIPSNSTIFFNAYSGGQRVVYDISSGKGFALGDLSKINNLGLLFGLPIAIIFPIITAAVFPRSYSHFGLIVTGATIGIMQFFGFFNAIPFNEGMWAVAMAVIALGVMLGRR